MTADLRTLAVFAAVAETRNFGRAAERLGVTRSAVSQQLRKLEDELGVALVQRTTRSVALTEAGERLFVRVANALAEVDEAVGDVRDIEARPRGRLRLAVSSIAEWFLAGPLFASFIEIYPEVQLDVTVTDDEFDIVAAGYDAGVRLGEVTERDMVAVPASSDQRQMVVGAPAYLARHGAPKHPRELVKHSCIGWRPAPHLPPYRWEFTENGRDFAVALDPPITTNDMRVMLRTAIAGGGLTFGVEETFRPLIARGELAPLLEEFCPLFPGFYLYFLERRNIAPKLRALIDHIRKARSLM